MNERQKRFVLAYLMTGSGKDAAIEAGYKASRARQTSAELLRNPEVAEAIRVGQEDRAERLGIDADGLAAELEGIMAQAREGVPKVHRGEVVRLDGEPVMEPQLAAAVSAANALIKMHGIGAPQRVEHEHVGEVVYTLRIDPQHDAVDAIEAEGWDV